MTARRTRMTGDMKIRNLALTTQASYLQQVSLFARYFAKSPNVQWLGHSYIVHSAVVGADLGNWISQDLPPSARHLLRVTEDKDVYWKFP